MRREDFLRGASLCFTLYIRGVSPLISRVMALSMANFTGAAAMSGAGGVILTVAASATAGVKLMHFMAIFCFPNPAIYGIIKK